MTMIFYISAVVAVISTIMVITRFNAVHALLYLVVSLLAVAMVFFTLGAPFAAALEVIIYAGAIVVVLVFVVMMLNQGALSVAREKSWQKPGLWFGPSVLSLVLVMELIYVLMRFRSGAGMGGRMIGSLGGGTLIAPKEVAVLLFGPYVIGVELASLLLLAGLVAAFHLARRDDDSEKAEGKEQ